MPFQGSQFSEKVKRQIKLHLVLCRVLKPKLTIQPIFDQILPANKVLQGFLCLSASSPKRLKNRQMSLNTGYRALSIINRNYNKILGSDW